jgi:hypothetical protein
VPPGRRAWIAAVVAGACGVLASIAILGYLRYRVTPERRELEGYFRHTFPPIHAQVKSIQAGIAGLVDETAPPPETAAAILEENVLPSIDLVLEQLAAVRLETLDARSLHEGYVTIIRSMRADASAMREILLDGSIDAAEKRRRVVARVLELGTRFEPFYARTVQVLKENGIRVEGLSAAPRTPSGTATPPGPPSP